MRTDMRAAVSPIGWAIRLALLAMILFTFAAHAGVPNNRAEPAYAEEQTMLQVEQDARVPEPTAANKSSGRVHIDRHYLGQYGSTEANVIVQRGGNQWRVWRNGPVATTMGSLLVLAIVVIFVFYRMVGPARTDAPDTGRRIQRFNGWERWVHWATAISFVILAVTGLLLTFGKKLLIPLFGHDVFAFFAYVSKYIHNFLGPLFIVCSVLMFFTFLRRNFPRKIDWLWVKQGGGLVQHKHVPAGFFNAGEKAWFWFGVTLLGLVMSVSGLILDFIGYGQTRYMLQVANYLHMIGATFYIVAGMGHAFIGTWGTPGAYEAMRHGTVDEAWAKAHHRVWYEEVKAGVPPGTLDNQIPPDAPPPDSPPPAGGMRPHPGPAH